jgi:hypothetical protein
LDHAVELAKEKMSRSSAYHIACHIGYIADFMRSKGLINLRQRWIHGLKKPQQLGSRISKEALTARQEKLPSSAVLRAIGAIFAEATQPDDILISSGTALMLCAPERINELLRLRRNCVVEGEREFRGKVGLRWPGSKGFENTTKWVPTEMVSISRQSVANINQVTTAAHRLAVWYTANPSKLYLHDEAQHLRDQEFLTLTEIALVLWGDETATSAAFTWAQYTKKLPKLKRDRRNIAFRFKDVERAVIAMLPETFPFVPGSVELLCKDSLFVMRTNEMHSARATYQCMFSYVSLAVIAKHLGAQTDRKSIFERFGYSEDDGSAINLRSHSLRHYLNMLAQTGGMSSTEIAIFSGRKDVKQNRAYDHMTSAEVQAPISQALKDGFTSGLEPVSEARRNLFARSDFNRLGMTAAHTTDYGWCVHDFASEPCQLYRDCINCAEQECIKGEEHKEENLRSLKGETEYLLMQALEALGEEEYGADTWVKHQTNTLTRVNTLLSIMADPAVPDGARIRLDVANVPLITVNNVHPASAVKNTKGNALS